MDKVLIVDDDAQLLLIITESLKKYKNKFRVFSAKDGLEGIGALQRENFSLVVTDLYMPRINGIVLLSYMTKNFPDIPCIIMTGHSTRELRDNLAHKVIAFIQKPFEVSILADAIMEALGQRRNLLGTMNGVSVPGFLKLVELEAMTCLCEMQSEDGETGYLLFDGGVLKNAYYNQMRGREAAVELFKMDSVTIKFRKPPKKKYPRRITGKLSAILDEALASS